jgi:hypothetical protein
VNAKQTGSASRRPVVIFQHVAVSSAGTVGAVLEAERVPYVVRHPYAGDRALAGQLSPAAIILLGGA